MKVLGDLLPRVCKLNGPDQEAARRQRRIMQKHIDRMIDDLLGQLLGIAPVERMKVVNCLFNCWHGRPRKRMSPHWRGDGISLEDVAGRFDRTCDLWQPDMIESG